MQITRKFYSEDFLGRSNKEAYLKACSWYAQKVMAKSSKVEVKLVLFKTEILKDTDFPTCRMELYVTYDDDQLSKSRCTACKEFHCLFYVNEQYNCQKCSQEGYRGDLIKKIENISNYFKKQLETTLNNDN